MAAPPPSYTQVTHTTSYSGIDPTQPALSTAGKVVLITGASGGIGRATALSFALSGPRALIILGRRTDALAATASSISASNSQLPVRTHAVELTDSSATQAAMSAVAEEFGAIDILVHAAGVLAPVELLVDADPNNFLAGYKTTIVGTLVAAQSAVRTNKEAALTFINLTTAGILLPPFPSMGAYVSSKIAAVKLLEVFAIENPQVRVHHVHPGLLETAMSAQLAEKVTLPYAYDDISLPADFLVWIASPEAAFTKNKIVFSSWDVQELKARHQQILGGPPGTGELWFGYTGFPRFIAGQALPGRG